MTKLGNPYMTLQHGWTIDEDEYGLLTSEMSWEGDFAFRHTIQKQTLHPYDPRLTAYRRRVQRLSTGKCRVTLSYIGIASDPTPMFIDHPGGSGQDAIQTHPDFTRFAGTPEEPENGAYFDPETGEFIGFTDPDNDLVGTTAYIVPSVLINLTYYTHFVPYLGAVGKRYSFSIPNLYKPANVRNFLLIGMPYKQIGNLFQITHQVLGSGPNGWNRKIY